MFHRLNGGLSLRSRFRPHLRRPGERVVVLRTASVFPPGHPTTRLCLTLLAEACNGWTAASLLDVGCGSGVLALAAAALGVPRVAAVDLAWKAARLTLENSRQNGLASVVRVIQGSPACLRGPFAVIAANLPFPVQLAEAASLMRLAASDGTLILSGFRDVQEEALLRLYRAGGWGIQARLTADDWPHLLPPEGSFTWAAWRLAPQR